MFDFSCFPMVKKVFPGSNSAYGFFPLYNYIIEKDANRLYIIKGGPGSGKSTFMKKIGEEFLNKKFQVELHYCSSNSESLDGLVIPAQKVAIIDGTAPHVVDPLYFGAFDEIIHLGALLNNDQLRENKDSIVKINEEKQRYFNFTYTLLSTAKLYLDEVENCLALKSSKEKSRLNQLIRELIEEVLGKKYGRPTTVKLRKLFASGITPQGSINYLNNLTSELNYVYILYGENGELKSRIVSAVMEAALKRELFVEAYCCALDPNRIEHIIIPQLKLGFVSSQEPHHFSRRFSCREIDIEKVSVGFQKENKEEKQEFYERYRGAFTKAIYFLNKAKELHDKLEDYYIATMKFDELDNLQQKIIFRIMNEKY